MQTCKEMTGRFLANPRRLPYSGLHTVLASGIRSAGKVPFLRIGRRNRQMLAYPSARTEKMHIKAAERSEQLAARKATQEPQFSLTSH